MRNPATQIVYAVLLLFPLITWGQQTGKWGNGKLRQTVVSISSDVPFATAAYDFTERYLTELQGMSVAERKSKMERDNVQIQQGGLDLLNLINEQTSMNFSERENRYIVSFVNESFLLIELSFPASCQLLTGKNLKELEAGFVKELASYSYISSTSQPDRKELKKLTGDYYVRVGDTYYVEEINGNLYFEEKSRTLRPVFSMNHPAESVFNLFLSEDTPCNALVNLTVRQYGLKREQMELPVHSLMAYMRNQGCALYVGIEALETNVVKAYVFAVNTVLKYNHVMSVEIPYSLLSEGKGKIEGDITLFVPTHNLSSLFEELNWVNTTPKRQIKVK